MATTGVTPEVMVVPEVVVVRHTEEKMEAKLAPAWQVALNVSVQMAAEARLAIFAVAAVAVV